MGEFQGLPTGTLKNEALQLEYLANSPRIVRLTPTGGDNLFADLDAPPVKTPYGEFHFRGGHRLWHAPEAMPRTYMPDNEGASLEEVEQGVRIRQPVEEATGIAKTLTVTLDGDKAGVEIVHELRNAGDQPVELAPWGITMLRQGGVAIVPTTNPASDPAGLLPDRHIVLWPYTRMEDPRLVWRPGFALVAAKPALPPLKLGFWNTQGWMAYWLDGVLFVKRFAAPADPAGYPDRGCNAEIYCNDQFIELETLGPLASLAPGDHVGHTETWELSQGWRNDLIPKELQQAVADLPG